MHGAATRAVPLISDPMQSSPAGESIELSIVLPCLNEAETLGACVEKAFRALRENGIPGEVVVADNGSTDGSREIAERLGARVAPVMEKGYGSALMGGIAAARGKYILMGDADGSYDFLEAPNFLRSCAKGTTWCRAAGSSRAAEKWRPRRCRSCIAGWATPHFR